MSAQAQLAALEALVEAHTQELHLPTVRQRFRTLAAEATREQQTPLAYLAALLEAEVAERAERRERRRLLDARFPLLKRLEDFRFADNPSVPQATIAALAEGSWITDRESIILSGESGTGKTHLAIALGHKAVHAGYRVYYTTAADLVARTTKAAIEGRWQTTMRFWNGPQLLIVDELGYLPLPAEAASHLFQVVSRRYEHGSIILTTNRGIASWGEIFDDQTVAAAILDRLLHHGTVLTINGPSYRMRRHQEKTETLRAGLLSSQTGD